VHCTATHHTNNLEDETVDGLLAVKHVITAVRLRGAAGRERDRGVKSGAGALWRNGALARETTAGLWTLDGALMTERGQCKQTSQ